MGVRSNSEKISDRPNRQKAMAVEGAMRGGRSPSISGGIGASVSWSTYATQLKAYRNRTSRPTAISSIADNAARRRASAAAVHKPPPARTSASAVSRDIRGQSGTRFVSCSMPKTQPKYTNRPTATATMAANRAR
jgi:hypothetical protein